MKIEDFIRVQGCMAQLGRCKTIRDFILETRKNKANVNFRIETGFPGESTFTGPAMKIQLGDYFLESFNDEMLGLMNRMISMLTRKLRSLGVQFPEDITE